MHPTLNEAEQLAFRLALQAYDCSDVDLPLRRDLLRGADTIRALIKDREQFEQRIVEMQSALPAPDYIPAFLRKQA